MRMMFILKWLLVLVLCLIGTFLLLHGLGAQIPWIKLKGMEAHNLPAGAALLVTGVVLAIFWKVQFSRTEDRSYTDKSTGQTIKEKIKTDIRFMR